MHPSTCKNTCDTRLSSAWLDPDLTQGVLIELIGCRKERKKNQTSKESRTLEATAKFYE